MDKPNIAARRPTSVNLEPGSVWWCACGLSKTQPYCDGSHAGSTFQPMEVKVDEKKTVSLCNCKHTKNPPYCDGSHRTC